MTKDNQQSALIALTTAALMLQGASKKVEASTFEPITTFDYKYSNYSEGSMPSDKVAIGSVDRYSIDIHQFKFKTPITEDIEISVSGVQEAMSGASPWYILPDENGKAIQVMSGATIEEKRSEISGEFRSYNKNSDSALSLSYSTEDDYRSFSFGYSGSFQFNQKQTTIDYGINTSKDYIDAVDSDIYTTRPVEETKDRVGIVLGFSQVLTKNTLVGISLGYNAFHGFLSDAYKLAYVQGDFVQDSRPDTHNQASLNLMLRQFFPSANAALHLDYRRFSSDWNIDSDTVELSWHQNFGKGWQFIPSIRHYQQTQAEFYRPFYLQARNDGFYSADYRLSEFSSTSGSLKIAKKFEKFTINISYESYDTSGDNPGLINYQFYSLGMGYKFQ
jgi:hypothetical protein